MPMTPLRPEILHALAWQVIAEMWRRHGSHRKLRLLETHPGASIEGQLRLLIDWDSTADQIARGVVFNIGGTSGTCCVTRSCIDNESSIDFVTPMLVGDPSLLIDRLDRELGLTTPSRLPPSSAAVVVARTLASALLSQCFSRNSLRVTMGWLDMSAGSAVPDWTQMIYPESTALKEQVQSGKVSWNQAFDQLGHLSALHRDNGAGPLLQSDHPLVLFDWKAGEMIFSRETGGEKIELMEAYKAAGRSISPIVFRALAHLGC